MKNLLAVFYILSMWTNIKKIKPTSNYSIEITISHKLNWISPIPYIILFISGIISMWDIGLKTFFNEEVPSFFEMIKEEEIVIFISNPKEYYNKNSFKRWYYIRYFIINEFYI